MRIVFWGLECIVRWGNWWGRMERMGGNGVEGIRTRKGIWIWIGIGIWIGTEKL